LQAPKQTKQLQFISTQRKSPKQTSLPKVKTETIFDIGCDDLGPSVTIILSIHALHMQ
jgi:hypothetical protein